MAEVVVISVVILGFLYWQERRITALEKSVLDLRMRLSLRAANQDATDGDAPSADVLSRAYVPQTTTPATTAPETTEPAPTPFSPKPKVPGPVARALSWLAANWIYPLAGVALFFAALYLVQYSIEHNLVSPATRITLAAILGLALAAGGEAVRRRWPDEVAGLVPATLAGAGVAVLFATPLAAYHLYDMIGQGTTLALLALVAVGAIGLGWVHGAFLSAFGVLAGAAAPFLLGEGGAPRDLLYAYFGAIGVAGLMIDGYRRWGWVAIVAVAAPMGAGALILSAGAGDRGFAALAVVLSAMAAATPFGRLYPHGIDARPWPRPGLRYAPVLIGLGLGSVVIGGQTALGLGVILLPLFAALIAAWTWRAEGQGVLAGIPLLAGTVFLIAPMGEPMALARIAALNAGLPLFPYLVIGATVIAAGLMLARPVQGQVGETIAMAAPAASVVLLDLFWGQSAISGTGAWAAVAMALAALYTVVAVTRARANPLRQGLAIVAAYALIALALVLMLSDVALTVALAVQMLAAVFVDRRLKLPVLALAYGAAALGLVWHIGAVQIEGWRALAGGLESAPALEVLLTAAIALAVPAATWVMGLRMEPNRVRGLALTLVSAAIGILVPLSVLLLFHRFVGTSGGHLLYGVELAVFAALSTVNFWRAGLEAPGVARWTYRLIGAVQAFVCVVLFVALLSLVNPYLGSSWLTARVNGVILVNDLLLAYLLPAGVLLAVSRRVTGRMATVVFMAALAMFIAWAQLVIRHAWQGGDAMVMSAGMRQGELYTYTVAMLVLGATFLALAMRTGAERFRYLSLGIIGVAACKAFLVDAAGLSGLLRVGAFLGLGLSLVALAWLNGRIKARLG